MNKIKYKVMVILASSVLAFSYFLGGIVGWFEATRDLLNYKCPKCEKVIEDPKKLFSHIKLGCFDVNRIK